MAACREGLCRGWEGGREIKQVAEQIRVLRNNRWGGSRYVWALSMSPAVVHIAPSIDIAAWHWAEANLLVNFTIPAHFWVNVFGKWGIVYHTSAA